VSASPCCARCGAGLPGWAGRGQRPKWCSTGCRRAAEYEVRRLVRRLERLDGRLAELREVKAGVAFSHRRAKVDADVGHYEHERQRAEDRLAELLDEARRGVSKSLADA